MYMNKCREWGIEAGVKGFVDRKVVGKWREWVGWERRK